MKTLPVAVQVYSVREDAEKDFAGTMKKNKEIGYDGVELAGLYGLEPAAIKAALWDVTYTGVTGDIAFDDVNGDAIRDTAYIKHSTNDGAWELETVQTVEQ